MIIKLNRKKLKACLALLCSLCLLGNAGCICMRYAVQRTNEGSLVTCCLPTNFECDGVIDLCAAVPLGTRQSSLGDCPGSLEGNSERQSGLHVHAETTLADGSLSYLNLVRSSLQRQLLAPSASTGTIVLTPVADATVQQLTNRSGSTARVRTTGPGTSTGLARIQGVGVDRVNRSAVFNFLRYGLATGGAINLSGMTHLEDYPKSLPVPDSGRAALDQAGFGAAGILEFDLSSLKTALEQLKLNASTVRATLRLTPIRSLNISDFLSDALPFDIPSTTQVAVLEMAQIQKDMIIDHRDFPGFTSPRVSNLQDLVATINNMRPEQRATVRTDLLGLLEPLNFDVTETIQRDVQTATAATGFQVVSDLNGTGLIFADSSMQIPGLSELIAPQLIIELAGFAPSGQVRFVASTTRIPYDTLNQGSTDLMLVTINNVGESSGAVALDLTSGSNAFGLITTDGKPLSAQGNTATISAGERLTFGVTFKPAGEGNFQGELQMTDTTGGKHELVGRIALTGSSLPSDLSAGVPTITAPIKPQRLPDHAARVGDLNGDGLIDAVDVGQLSAIVAGRMPAPSAGTTPFAVADINGDGLINSMDVSTLGDALARNLNALPRLRPGSIAIRENLPARQSTQVAIARANAAHGRGTRAPIAVRPR